jgi:hypothetical protein
VLDLLQISIWFCQIYITNGMGPIIQNASWAAALLLLTFSWAGQRKKNNNFCVLKSAAFALL